MTGIQRAEERFSQAAEETAEASVPIDQISISGADPMINAQVEQMTAQLSYKANIKTLQSAQQMDETLLQLFTT